MSAHQLVCGHEYCQPYTPVQSPDVCAHMGMCTHVSQVWGDHRRADSVHERQRVQSQLQSVECTSHLRPPCPPVEKSAEREGVDNSEFLSLFPEFLLMVPNGSYLTITIIHCLRYPSDPELLLDVLETRP